MTDNYLVWSSVPGTEIQVGDYVIGDYSGSASLAVNSIALGQLPEGAKYLDATLENGEVKRCWQGFLYRVGRLPEPRGRIVF